MPEIVLVRQDKAELSTGDREAARRVLFGIVDGLGEDNRKRWRRFFNALMRMEPGEVATLLTKNKRSGIFHRRHMLIETRVFEAQERIEDFKQFRYWLKVGAGLVDWMPGPKGGVIPFAKSISYEDMEDGEMREFHGAVSFGRKPMPPRRDRTGEFDSYVPRPQAPARGPGLLALAATVVVPEVEPTPIAVTPAEQHHLDRVAALRCVLCRRLSLAQEGKTDIHHLRVGQGGAQRASNWLVAALCHFRCHQGPHGIHGDRSLLRQAKCTEIDLLGWTLEDMNREKGFA